MAENATFWSVSRLTGLPVLQRVRLPFTASQKVGETVLALLFDLKRAKLAFAFTRPRATVLVGSDCHCSVMQPALAAAPGADAPKGIPRCRHQDDPATRTKHA
jgi:hypothetical protein